MDPILTTEHLTFFSLEELANMDDYDDLEVSDKTMSLWIKDKDVISPSTNITLLKTLEPGIYAVNSSRDTGLTCKKINTKSDELFIFSDSITQKLLDEINDFWSKSELYKEKHLIHKRGILLEGHPGTGKSSIITILSDEIIKKGGIVFKVTNFRNLDSYVTFIQNYFRKIQPETPIITILEDLDQYESVESELLDFLDGKTHINHHVLIATTNDTESIPDTFLRPSRIDLKIEVPLPNAKTRKEYFQNKGVPEEDIESLVTKSAGFSLADLKEIYICIYLLNYSILNAIQKVASPRKKKNYQDSPLTKTKLGFNNL